MASSVAIGAVEIDPNQIGVSVIKVTPSDDDSGIEVYFKIQNNSPYAIDVALFGCNVFDTKGVFFEIITPGIRNVAKGKSEYAQASSKIGLADFGRTDCRVTSAYSR